MDEPNGPFFNLSLHKSTLQIQNNYKQTKYLKQTMSCAIMPLQIASNCNTEVISLHAS